MDTMYGQQMTNHELEWIRMNDVFVLSAGGNAITMDELNKFLNLWNKSCVGTSIFETFCERSKHILTLMKSAYATFGHKRRKRHHAIGSQENSIQKLVDFFTDANIFPSGDDLPCKLTKDFFCDRVRRPKKVGTVQARNKEGVTLSIGRKLLQERLCGTESLRKYYDDFESNCDDASIASMA